ncbi:hypothetical protein ABT142_33550 [Streptomyces sp. NPDC001857]
MVKQLAKQGKAGGGLSLREENRRLLAARDRIREQRRARGQAKSLDTGG